MGQKVNPNLIRLGSVYNWSSRWFDNKHYKDVILEDYVIRSSLMKRLAPAGIARVEIDRSINSIKITAFVARPGIVIGRGGTGVEDLKNFILKLMSDKTKTKHAPKIEVRVEAIKDPNLDSYLVAKNISDQLVRRLPFKRVIGQAAEKSITSGAKGIRIVLSGRISGAEIARREKLQRGTVPLSTIREHVSFASVPALTKKGYVGVKVWINRKEE